MKKTVAIVLALVLLAGQSACTKRPDTARDTQPTQQTTEATQIVTDPAESDPYEKYISSAPKGTYRYMDLNGDGQQELFIFRDNDRSEVVTVADGEVVRILHAFHLFLCDDGIIGRWSEGSGGQTLFFYRIENLDAKFLDVISMTYHDDAWYHSTEITDILDVSPKNMNQITKDEATNIIGQYALLEENIPYYLTLFYPVEE